MNPNATEFKFTPSSASAAPFVPRFAAPPPGFAPAPAATVVAVPAAPAAAAVVSIPAPSAAPAAAAPAPQAQAEPEVASWEDTADKQDEPAPAKETPAPAAAAPSPTKTEEYKPSDAELRAELERIAKEEGVSASELLKDDDADAVADAIADLKVEDAKEDSREHLHVVFIGHVDAGKSTISGNILFLTGQVDARTIQKYEQMAKENNRESWFFAYIMDTNDEERAKGKTVEVGRAHFETTNKRYTILDAPGHKNYVPNMIGGASQADVAVLVISARKGEFSAGFEGGQTKEHAMLVKTLGVKYLICVINKMDDPTVAWSQSRYDDIVRDMNAFLKTIGFNLKADVYYIPVSGLKGSNLRDHSTPEEAPWYTGPTLLEQLDQLKPLDRRTNNPLRIPIIDKGKDRGATQVMGKLESGMLRLGDKLIVVPNNIRTECIGIYAEDIKPIKSAKAGDSVKLLLKGVEEDQLHSGFVICPLANPVPCQARFEAMLNVMELLPHKPIFTPGYSAVIHIHAAVEECSILHLVAQLDPKTQAVTKKRPTHVPSKSLVRCIIECSQPIPLELFSDNPQLGRFTLRDEGKTIAVGKVITLQSQKKKDAAAAGSASPKA